MPRRRPEERASVSESGEAQQAAAALDHLGELLRKGAELDRVVDGYLETRRLLSATFRRLAKARVQSSEAIVDAVRARILDAMRNRYGPSVPDDLLFVRRYGETHALLLAYLSGRAGQFVSAARLRLLTGDQVHTERRLRELRDLGYEVDAGRVSGEHQYALVRSEPDVGLAALTQLKANIKASKLLSGASKRELLAALDAA